MHQYSITILYYVISAQVEALNHILFKNYLLASVVIIIVIIIIIIMIMIVSIVIVIMIRMIIMIMIIIIIMIVIVTVMITVMIVILGVRARPVAVSDDLRDGRSCDDLQCR